jgi:hypothetical protein
MLEMMARRLIWGSSFNDHELLQHSTRLHRRVGCSSQISYCPPCRSEPIAPSMCCFTIWWHTTRKRFSVPADNRFLVPARTTDTICVIQKMNHFLYRKRFLVPGRTTDTICDKKHKPFFVSIVIDRQ